MREASGPSPYSEAWQPFVRGRVDAQGHAAATTSKIDRDNTRLQQRLREIGRKPSGTIPPPQRGLHAQASAVSRTWETFKQHNVPRPASAGKDPCRARNTEVQLCNAALQRKLAETYSVRKDSLVRQHQLDCNPLWHQRTALYSPGSSRRSRPATAPARSASAAGASHQNSSSSSCSGVPKTLGVASCAGCGRRSFFQADGPALRPCQHCRRVFYCSDFCANVDQPSHKALCRFYTTGQWTPAGIRPAADCWVVNRSMAVARKLLHRHRLQGDEGCHADEGDWEASLLNQLNGVRQQEQQEEEAQQLLEQRAFAGLEGPRPCLCSGGVEWQGKQ